MNEVIPAVGEWLAARGPPNVVFLAALLTSPWTWASKLRERVGPLLDRVLPGSE